MGVEVSGMVPSESRYIKQKLETYKKQYEGLNSLFVTSKSRMLDSLSKQAQPPVLDTKAFSAVKEIGDRATMSLENSRQIVAETEKIGSEVISELEEQREKLVSAKSNIEVTRGSAVDARGVLSSMTTKAFFLNVFLVFMNLLLLAIIAMIVYFGYIMKKWGG
jgi:vesicle transport through interaction with t-SNAREs 1